MNALRSPWHGLDVFGVFALQICLLIVLAWIAQIVTQSPHRRRVIWYVSFFGLALLLLNAALGIETWMLDRRSKPASNHSAFIVRGNLPEDKIGADIPVLSADPTTSFGSEPTSAKQSVESGAVMAWVAHGWVAGTIAILLWSIIPRLGLAFVSKRSKCELAPRVQTRLRELERCLLLDRPVRLIVWSRLSSPIAFGVIRPTIGLPADFWNAYSAEEQDAMLAHELAHLAAHDPAGLGFVDLVTALLWWHPMVWWGRRQFRAASETAADEASLILNNGPAVLAGCLIRMASRWQQRGLLGLLGVAGFRSGLGKRVQRLLEFCPTATPVISKRPTMWLVALFGGLLASVAASGAITLIPGRAEAPLLVVVLNSLKLSEEPPRVSNLGIAPAHTSAASPNSAGVERKQEVWVREYLRTVLAQQRSILPGMDRTTTNTAFDLASGVPRSKDFAPFAPDMRLERPSPARAFEPASTPHVAFDPSFEAYLKTKGKSQDQIQTLLLRANALIAQRKPDSKALDPAALLDMIDKDQSTPSGGKPDSVNPDLRTRSYHVNPDNVLSAVVAITGQTADAEISPLEALRRILSAAGIDVVTPASGRSLFYNARNGIVLVRAPLAELDTIEQVLQALNAVPPQVLIEAKFVEISRTHDQPLRIVSGNGDAAAQPPSERARNTNNLNTVEELLSDPRFREVVIALEHSGKQTPAPNKVRGDQLEWSGRTATNASRIVVDQTVGETTSGVLTDPQFRAVLRRLQDLPGVDVLSAPKVTTLSQRRAQVQVNDVKSVITGLNSGALLKTQASATNPPTFTVAQIPVGPVLDVLPVVLTDATTVRLTVSPTVTEFLGYDKPPKDARQRVWENGVSRIVDVPLPRMRVRQMTTEAVVTTGQTLVLGGIPVEDTIFTKDKVPVLGDIPLLGRLFRREGKQNIRKTLLVFVTATIIDPAGNPLVHSKP